MKIDWFKNFSKTGLISGALVFLGILLSVTIGMQFLLITGLGAFGPGFLREFGLLKDQDEFARMASYRAGYIASLIAGSVAILLIAFIQAGSVELIDESLALAIVLAIIWLVTIFTSIKKFWGVQRAVFRILVTFGTFWLIFVILSHIQEPITFLMESLVVLPFFILAWLSLHWPRIAGALIVIVGVACFFLFRIYDVSPELLLQKVMVFILFICPLLVAGYALLTQKQDIDDATIINDE